MVFAHVIYKKTGLERKNVTPKAYNLLKNQYTLLGWVDENGNPVQGPEEQQPKAKTTQKKSAEPVVNEPRKQMSQAEIESKKLELKALNEAAIQKAKDEQAKELALKEGDKVLVKNVELEEFNGVKEVAKEKKKPGPKPKAHA